MRSWYFEKWRESYKGHNRQPTVLAWSPTVSESERFLLAAKSNLKAVVRPSIPASQVETMWTTKHMCLQPLQAKRTLSRRWVDCNSHHHWLVTWVFNIFTRGSIPTDNPRTLRITQQHVTTIITKQGPQVSEAIRITWLSEIRGHTAWGIRENNFKTLRDDWTVYDDDNIQAWDFDQNPTALNSRYHRLIHINLSYHCTSPYFHWQW